MSNRRRLWTPGGRHTPAQPQPEVRELKGEGPELRLLVCQDCRSIEELPPYEGDPRRDILLEDSLSRHMTGEHTVKGETRYTGSHKVSVLKVAQSFWSHTETRERITKQISAGGSRGIEELEGAEDYYGTRDTYREDALKCFQRHHRPDEGCIDYQNPDKRIGNPTSEGWKTGPRVYACNFCPVQTWVDKKKAEAAGV